MLGVEHEQVSRRFLTFLEIEDISLLNLPPGQVSNLLAIAVDLGVLHGEPTLIDLLISFAPHLVKVVLLDDDQGEDEHKLCDVHPPGVGLAVGDYCRDDDADDEGEGAGVEQFEE